MTMSKDQFWRRVKLVHGDRYDYSKAEYTKTTLPITVTCRVHGDFQVAAYAHLRGQNCMKCAHDDTRRRMVGNKNAAVDQRDLFEKVFRMPSNVERHGTGYHSTSSDSVFIFRWEGWLACHEQSRKRKRG